MTDIDNVAKYKLYFFLKARLECAVDLIKNTNDWKKKYKFAKEFQIFLKNAHDKIENLKIVTPDLFALFENQKNNYACYFKYPFHDKPTYASEHDIDWNDDCEHSNY